MKIAGKWRAAGALFGPGFIGRRGASRTRGVGVPAAEGVGLRAFMEHGVSGVFVGKLKTKLLFSGQAMGALLFLLHEDLRIGVGKFFALEDVDVIAAGGHEFPEVWWEIAVVRTGKMLSARAPLHFGFELPGVPFADFERVFAVQRFVKAFESVLVDAVFEGLNRSSLR